MRKKIVGFLKTGSWKNIQLGMSIQSLLEIDSSIKLMTKHLYQKEYNDSYAIFYDKDALEISIYKDEIVRLALRNPRDKKIFGVQSLSEVICFLYKQKIQWAFEQKYCFNTQLCVKTEGGVNIMFYFECKNAGVCSVSKGI